MNQIHSLLCRRFYVTTCLDAQRQRSAGPISGELGAEQDNRPKADCRSPIRLILGPPSLHLLVGCKIIYHAFSLEREILIPFCHLPFFPVGANRDVFFLGEMANQNQDRTYRPSLYIEQPLTILSYYFFSVA